MATRHTGIGESRVSFEEFMFVALGSVLSTWNVAGVPLNTSLDLIQELAKSEFEMTRIVSTEWLQSLATTATQVKSSKGTAREQITRLVSFGQRRCATFLAPAEGHPPPAFGLVNLKTVLATFGDNTNGRVALLRVWASRPLSSSPQLKAAIIRFRENEFAAFRCTPVTAIEAKVSSKKRRRGTQATDTVIQHAASLTWMCSSAGKRPTALELRELEERSSSVSISPRLKQQSESYKFMYGDPNTAAIFMPSGHVTSLGDVKNEMSVRDLVDCIKNGNVTATKLASLIFIPEHHKKYELYFHSLSAVRQAERIYTDLLGARVELQVTSLTIGSSEWWKSHQNARAVDEKILSRTFSCIALFETGYVDINPDRIGEDVIAVSHTNSIFVARALLLDPSEAIPEVPVERIIGSVGKPGLAILIPPPDPKTRKIDYSSWNLVDHKAFDGKSRDSFEGTSLHLSFTGFELPLDVGMRSARDQPAVFIETVVSVYDRGEWVADLDIMKSCKTWASQRQDRSCAHSTDQKADISLWAPLIAIDSWLEFLDQPVETCVVRALGNTSARLAAAALAVQKDRDILVMPMEECWQCLRPAFYAIAHNRRMDNNHMDDLDMLESSKHGRGKGKKPERLDNDMNDSNGEVNDSNGSGEDYSNEEINEGEQENSCNSDMDETKLESSSVSEDESHEGYGIEDAEGTNVFEDYNSFDLNPPVEVVAATVIMTFIC